MTSEKLKGKIKSFSEKSNLKAQEVLQMYFFERFLTRLEKSKYRAKFIIKGGFLISSIIGIQNRTTMDYDIYMIFKLKNDKINVNNLKQAILETAKNRNSMEEILESKEILEDIKNNEYLNKQWNIYKNENKYVDNIPFSEILRLLNKIADIIQVDLL